MFLLPFALLTSQLSVNKVIRVYMFHIVEMMISTFHYLVLDTFFELSSSSYFIQILCLAGVKENLEKEIFESRPRRITPNTSYTVTTHLIRKFDYLICFAQLRQKIMLTSEAFMPCITYASQFCLSLQKYLMDVLSIFCFYSIPL